MSRENFSNGKFILEGPSEVKGYEMLVRMGVKVDVKNNKELIKYLKKGYTIIDYIPEQIVYFSNLPSKW